MAEKKLVLLPFEKPLGDLYDKIEKLKRLSEAQNIDLAQEIQAMEEKTTSLHHEIFEHLTPTQIVQIARHSQRPTTLDYIDLICEDFVPLHGDRYYADDPAIVGGLSWLGGEPIMILGHQKGKNTKENIARNFGMANPEGYRKAIRLMKLAEKFGRPIITLIDTPGAYPGIGAEERGQAEAIARNLREMSQISVPMIIVITGEGGSGGALGIGMGNRVLMLEFCMYSVISPEGCASILYRDAKKADIAAENMKITVKDLFKLGVIDEIIKEPFGGAHRDAAKTAQNIKSVLLKHLAEIKKMKPEELVTDRYNKFRQMGEFVE